MATVRLAISFMELLIITMFGIVAVTNDNNNENNYLFWNGRLIFSMMHGSLFTVLLYSTYLNLKQFICNSHTKHLNVSDRIKPKHQQQHVTWPQSFSFTYSVLFLSLK